MTLKQHPGDLAGGFSELEMTWLLYCAGTATGQKLKWAVQILRGLFIPMTVLTSQIRDRFSIFFASRFHHHHHHLICS